MAVIGVAWGHTCAGYRTHLAAVGRGGCQHHGLALHTAHVGGLQVAHQHHPALLHLCSTNSKGNGWGRVGGIRGSGRCCTCTDVVWLSRGCRRSPRPCPCSREMNASARPACRVQAVRGARRTGELVVRASPRQPPCRRLGAQLHPSKPRAGGRSLPASGMCLTRPETTVRGASSPTSTSSTYRLQGRQDQGLSCVVSTGRGVGGRPHPG